MFNELSYRKKNYIDLPNNLIDIIVSTKQLITASKQQPSTKHDGLVEKNTSLYVNFANYLLNPELLLFDLLDYSKISKEVRRTQSHCKLGHKVDVMS